MAEENVMCSVLELGISGDSYDLLKNLCEDVGIEAVEKDFMSIVLDVSEKMSEMDGDNIGLVISSGELELELDTIDGENVLLGFFPIGDGGVAAVLNGLVEEFSPTEEEDGETEEEEKWTNEDALSFVIGVGEIDKDQMELLQGKINTHISTNPLMFDEGDVVNMTVGQLGNFYLG